MVWARLDDSFYDHPKLDLLGDVRLPAIGLFAVALSWSNKWLTDGQIPAARVLRLGGTTELAEALVSAGLWERSGRDYLIHDFLDYSKGKNQVETERRQRSAAGRAGGLARRERAGRLGVSPSDSLSEVLSTRDGTGRDSRPLPLPEPSRTGSQGLVRVGEVLDDGGWEGFDESTWGLIRRPWMTRFQLPPRGSIDDPHSQRSLLWEVLDKWPESIAGWIDEAPRGASSYQVVDYVMRRRDEAVTARIQSAQATRR